MALRILYSISSIHTSKALFIPKFVILPRTRYSLTTQLNKKPLYKNEKAKKIKFFVIHKYMQYFKKFAAIAEKRFPRVAYLYRLFVEGTRDFFIDLRRHLNIVRALNINGKSLKDLTRAEIELYEQMPKDMRRVGPLLFFSMFPGAYFILFPLIYLFPRQLLCRHFWNLQQKSDFSIIYIGKRLLHNKPVLRHLQLQLKGLHGNTLHKKWSNILGQLGSGVHPMPEQILECKDLFINGPYHLMYLSRNHINHLLKMHDVPALWFKRSKLADRAILLQAMDKAILREGGVQELSIEALKHACLIRGLNPRNMRNEDMTKWLTQWIAVSNNIHKDGLSLLLHCPVLLGYNQPSNWQLIYPSKNKS